MKFFYLLITISLSLPVSAFECSIFEGAGGQIPSFDTEIAELKNLEKNGRHLKILVPKQGAVQEFDLDEYVQGLQTDTQVRDKLSAVKGASVVYIDLYPVQKRYEIRMGLLTMNLKQVIKPTVYGNYAYNEQHNEIYDLENNIAVFCN